MSALARPSEPPPGIARPKYAPRRSAVPRCESPVDSTPDNERDTFADAFVVWASTWFRAHGVDVEFLAEMIRTSATLAGRKVTPRKTRKDPRSDFSFVDLRFLKPRLRAQFALDALHFISTNDASH